MVKIIPKEIYIIINNNDLSNLQTHILNRIYRNTLQWINKIGKTVDGQYQLLNTFSTDDVSKVAAYRSATVDDRFIYMAECKTAILVFLDYLWKIILDICQEKVNDEVEISVYLEMYDPCHYMDSSVTDYVCLNFPEDKYVNYSIILPSAGGKFKGVKRKIVERMVKISPKPGKWFFENSKLTRGKNLFKYYTLKGDNILHTNLSLY